jgi:hypothetical protein
MISMLRLYNNRCSFLSNMSMDIIVHGSRGVLCLYDFVIPYKEDSISFLSSYNTKFSGLHTGWESRPSEKSVMTELPQESFMTHEFARRIKSVSLKLLTNSIYSNTGSSCSYPLQSCRGQYGLPIKAC